MKKIDKEVKLWNFIYYLSNAVAVLILVILNSFIFTGSMTHSITMTFLVVTVLLTIIDMMLIVFGLIYERIEEKPNEKC